jgi:hypothetical protein
LTPERNSYPKGLQLEKEPLARLSGFDLRFKFFHFVTYEY